MKTQPVSSAPKMELHAKPNPAPPSIPGHGVIPAQKPEGQVNAISTSIKNPEKIELPDASVANKPTIAPPPSTLKTAEAGSGTSMVQRLKEKGVEIPSKNPIAPPSGINQTPMNTSPNKPQWPDEPTQ